MFAKCSSTFRLLSMLYAIRLRTFEIVVASIAAAALLTAIAATTVVRPLARLQRQAWAVAARRGALPAVFAGAGRRDEIGDLARALGELSRRTNDHIRLLESFSADVSHELKNPLASIRTAADTMADSESVDERRRFHELMVRDVARLEPAGLLGEHTVIEATLQFHALCEGLATLERRGTRTPFDADAFARSSEVHLTCVDENDPPPTAPPATLHAMLRESCRLEAATPTLAAVPALVLTLEDLAPVARQHVEAALLARVDGRATIEEILLATRTPFPEGLAAFDDLARLGVVVLG